MKREQKAIKVLHDKGFSAWLTNNKVSVLMWTSNGSTSRNMTIDDSEVDKLAQEYDGLKNPKG